MLILKEQKFGHKGNPLFIKKKLNLHFLKKNRNLVTSREVCKASKWLDVSKLANSVVSLMNIESQLINLHTFIPTYEQRNDLTFRLLMSYIYGAPILDVSRSHTTTQHSR